MADISSRSFLWSVILLVALLGAAGILGGTVRGASLPANGMANTVSDYGACSSRDAMIDADNDDQSASSGCPPDTSGFSGDIRLMVSSPDETPLGGHSFIDPGGGVLDTGGNPIDRDQVTLFSKATLFNSENEPLSLGADTSFTLHQDPLDGATGFKLFIAGVFDSESGDDVNIDLESFQAGFKYLDATTNPAVPVGTRCVELLDAPRGTDFPSTNLIIDNPAGSAMFDGSDVNGVSWPADLGHILTRLNGSSNQSCRVDLELSLTADTGGGPITAPPILTQILQRGDAQADGDVTIDDALFLARYLVNSTDECTTGADIRCLRWVNAASVRQDGAFDRQTVADALFIAQHLVGLRDEFYNLVQ